MVHRIKINGNDLQYALLHEVSGFRLHSNMVEETTLHINFLFGRSHKV